MKTALRVLLLSPVVLGLALLAGCSTVRHDDPRFWPACASLPVASALSVLPAPATPAAYPVPAALYALTNIFRADGLPVLDNPQILLFDGTRAAAQSAPDTQQWAANCPVMLLVLDINAPGLEDPVFGDDAWYSCGLLLRNCVYRNGRLMVADTFSGADINIIDATPGGLPDMPNSDFAGPRDENLPANLTPTLDAIKTALVKLLREACSAGACAHGAPAATGCR